MMAELHVLDIVTLDSTDIQEEIQVESEGLSLRYMITPHFTLH